MTTLRASKQGLTKIKQAREKKGWPVADRNWLEAASLCLGVNWEKTGYLAEGISEGTWSRFLAGKRSINASAFQAYSAVLGLNWEEVVNGIQGQDWGDAPDLPSFYGRAEELAKLKQWIVKDKCRLVAILGMGGIGKTALAVRSAEDIQNEFEYLIWRSLRASPPVEEVLADLIRFFSNDKKTALTDNTDKMVKQLIDYLRQHRCLVVLDEMQAILSSGKLAGHYREGYQDYSKLLREVGEVKHNSCFVLTSWENPKIMASLAEKTKFVHYLKLTGLKDIDAQEILTEKGLSDRETWGTLNQLYGGNPLSLKIVSITIKDFFNGSVAKFLEAGTIVIGDISEVLDRQFDRLTDLEKQIVRQLATNVTPKSLPQLAEIISPPGSKSELIEALESLERRSLIEKITGGSEVMFTLQPVVMKYIQKVSKISASHL
ncbi:XRE family transcriptional regulator [Argonema galeatum]|uniref:XRE family transcriptional regulator n=1 Tax=Argonema galeatum TaxID=2942762 RepID=UPI0020120587|nr:XRE family transcriptional regulator [Argonema galeatum]MCL1468074.1 AAA family ATPase [Argonema galeatum A003/A1]